MNHSTIPVTAQGEPIPLVKLGQGRGNEDANAEASGFMGLLVNYNEALAKKHFPGDYHQGEPLETTQTLAQKLAGVAYKAPKCDAPTPEYLAEQDARAELDLAALRAELIPLVSQKGFKAGVFATCLGGAFLAALYLGAGALICGCVTSGCIGFVAGMLMTQEWK